MKRLASKGTKAAYTRDYNDEEFESKFTGMEPDYLAESFINGNIGEVKEAVAGGTSNTPALMALAL